MNKIFTKMAIILMILAIGADMGSCGSRNQVFDNLNEDSCTVVYYSC